MAPPLGGLRRTRKRLRRPGPQKTLCQNHQVLLQLGLRPGQKIASCGAPWCEYGGTDY